MYILLIWLLTKAIEANDIFPGLVHLHMMGNSCLVVTVTSTHQIFVWQ